ALDEQQVLRAKPELRAATAEQQDEHPYHEEQDHQNPRRDDVLVPRSGQATVGWCGVCHGCRQRASATRITIANPSVCRMARANAAGIAQGAGLTRLVGAFQYRTAR